MNKNEDYIKYCNKRENKDQLRNCIINFNNMRALLYVYDEYKSILQMEWFQDNIGFEKFINEILVGKFNFNIKYDNWTIKDIYTNYNELRLEKKDQDPNKILKLENKIKKYINSISKDKNIYFIDFNLPQHQNLIYIDTYDQNNKYVYVYEPQIYEKDDEKYWINNLVEDLFRKSEYTVKNLPENILRQTVLPMCYMYVLHFFMYVFVSRDDKDIIPKYQDSIDDIYIMSFTRYILKLSHSYLLINDIDYYILTNNTYQIQKRLTDNMEINDLLTKVSSIDMLKIIYDKTKNIMLNISFFMYLMLYLGPESTGIYQKLFNILLYIVDINLPEKQTYELYLITKIYDMLTDTQLNTDKFEKFITENDNKKYVDTSKIIDTLYGKFTALMYASQFCRSDVVKFLLERDANPDNALATSYVMCNDLEIYNDIVDMLKKKDINIYKELIDSKIAFDNLNNLKINKDKKEGLNYLMFLYKYSTYKMIQDNNYINSLLKISDDVNVNDRNIYGQTILHMIYSKPINNVKCKENVGYFQQFLTYVKSSSYNKDCELVIKLLDRGIDPNIKDKNGKTALMLISEQKFSEGVEDMLKLILNKSDINLKDNNGDTDLMIAKKNSNEETAKILENKLN